MSLLLWMSGGGLRNGIQGAVMVCLPLLPRALFLRHGPIEAVQGLTTQIQSKRGGNKDQE